VNEFGCIDNVSDSCGSERPGDGVPVSGAPRPGISRHVARVSVSVLAMASRCLAHPGLASPGTQPMSQCQSWCVPFCPYFQACGSVLLLLFFALSSDVYSNLLKYQKVES